MESDSKPDGVAIPDAPKKRGPGRPKGSLGGNRLDRRWRDQVAPKVYTDDDVCEPWEEQYAKWLALQTSRVNPDEEQAAIRVLKGQDVSINALRRTKRKLGFKHAYQNARAEVHELQLKRARGRAIAIMPKAMSVMGKAVDALDAEFEKGKLDAAMDMLPAIRSAPPLLAPFLDRAIPRKTESATVATQIVVNLTPEQAKGLSAPIMVIEAEEVKRLPETVG